MGVDGVLREGSLFSFFLWSLLWIDNLDKEKEGKNGVRWLVSFGICFEGFSFWIF